jgi:hypothetical protein
MKIRMQHLFLMLYAGLFISILAGILVHIILHPHVHFWWEEIPVFSAIYGFIGCIIIIIASKALGHHWLQREEDYYEKH